MNVKKFVCAAVAAYSLSQTINAQDTIGVGVPTGTVRNDTYVGAGFEFYAPAGTGATINALGFWDQNGTGLLAAHTVSIFKYHPGILGGSGYDLIATATVPAGTNAPLIDGYRWVGIPTLTLPDNGQGGGYYAILGTQAQDAWTTGINPPPYLNSSIGTISGQGLLDSGNPYTVLSTEAAISGDSTPGDGFGGANLGFLSPQPPAQPPAVSIVWDAEGTFTSDAVLSLAGAASNEVYGVDFGGSGLQTTTNGYTFDDYATTGNITLAGNLSTYNAYLSGGGTTGDSSLDAILNNGIYGESDITATLNNLTIGQRYNVLAVAADTRTGGSTTQFAVTDDLTISLLQTLSFPGGTPAIGGYIEGTFTAGATNEVFTIFGEVQYNGILVEKAPAITIELVTNTSPANASVGSGSQIVFTAAFSNSPPVTLEWQQVIAGSVTNDINSGVINVTNNGVVSSTLTLTNLQVSNAGSYRLEAISTANNSDVAYSSPAPLTVIPLITWYAGGTYNNGFSDNTVLTYAGMVANEVYGVDFGGSGAQTTANGYTFNDYSDGNMSIAGTPSSYNGWLTGGATTGDPAFDAVLGNGIYGSTANTGTLNNLTVGQTYTVLVLLDDTRGPAAGWTTFHITDGVTVSPEQQYAFANGSPSVGGYIMGTFTAQATTQPLSVENNNGVGFYNSQYNAILLEKGIAPPPPVPPTLTTDIAPLLSEVPAGAAMTFSVAVAGSIPLAYQWSNQVGAVAGATNSSYEFNALPGTNSYSVAISNSYGALVSSTAVVIGLTNPAALITFDSTNWTLNNNGNVSPSFAGTLLTLTDGNNSEASSAFFDVGQYIGGFVASFVYQTSGGADGVTFCLQDSAEGTNALGGSGGDLGYTGITPSVAFEMNINPAAIHGGIGIRVGTNGTIGDFSNEGYVGTGSVNIGSGDDIYVQLYYQQGILSVWLIDPTVPATNMTSFSINLPAALGNGSAYVGFTGSDGGIASSQTVSNFVYSATTTPALAIAPGSAGQMVVSWPVSVSTLFTLVQSSNVTGPWIPAAPVASAIVGLQNQVTVSVDGSSSFYRLQLIDPNAP